MKVTGLVIAIFLLGAVDGAKMNRFARMADARLSGTSLTLDTLANIAHLGNRNSFRETNGEIITNAKGVKRCRLTQTYAGLDVYGSVVEAEADFQGRLTGQMYGVLALNLETDIPDPDACMQNVDDMLAIAITSEGFSVSDSDIDNKDGRRIVYVDPDSKEGHLAYRVEYFYAGSSDVSYPAYIIDACTQGVLASFNQVQNSTIPRARRQADDECETEAPTTTAAPPGPSTCAVDAAGVGGNQKTGRRDYNVAPFCLNVQRSGDTCTMENTYARVIDNEGSTSRSKQTEVSFTCSEGFNDPVNGAFGVASDAMYFGDITGRLYVEKYNVRALPYAPRLVVHYSTCYDNAFWNGVDMFFGDGCNYFYPLVNQDVVTHELGHGITTRNSNLEYRRESGGINEAFSDISGEVAEVFGRSSNDWQVGRELFKGNGALRYFIDPTDDGRSIIHIDQYNNGMDVHYSSGLYNHAFYQLVQIQGMPIYDAYKCFLDANLFLWGTQTGFVEGACGVYQACFDNGFDYQKVQSAFAVVGINIDEGSCSLASLSTVVYLGDARDNILVSATRNPVLELDIGDVPTVLIETTSEDGSPIEIEAFEDIECTAPLGSGTDSVSVDNPGALSIFVRLSSASASDVTVSLVVS